MQPDYPAAHSMDTMFFAVDKDGHVAVFNTGEAGCVPEGSLAGEQAYDVLNQLRRLPRCDIIHDLKGHRLPNLPEEAGTMRFFPGLEYPVLMFLSSLEPVQADIAAGNAVPVAATAGAGVVWRHLSEARYNQLVEAGVVQLCDYFFDAEPADGERPNPATHGLFYYNHLTENWISGPFGRERIPAQPVHVDQLPPIPRRLVKSLAFDEVSFRDAAHIQPFEHTSCESWEAAWLDLQGNIKPIPGREEEYAERYDEMKDIGEHFKIQPPDGHE